VLSGASIRRKLSALSSLFDYLCERNAAVGNPVDSVKRSASFRITSDSGRIVAARKSGALVESRMGAVT
jgi:integrase/recombinase XerD